MGLSVCATSPFRAIRGPPPHRTRSESLCHPRSRRICFRSRGRQTVSATGQRSRGPKGFRPSAETDRAMARGRTSANRSPYSMRDSQMAREWQRHSAVLALGRYSHDPRIPAVHRYLDERSRRTTPVGLRWRRWQGLMSRLWKSTALDSTILLQGSTVCRFFRFLSSCLRAQQIENCMVPCSSSSY